MVVAIELRNVTKELGRKLVLSNVSFQVKKGEIFGIIGMSGSGKSTLLSHLIGYIQPSEGQVFYSPNYSQFSQKGPILKELNKNIMEAKRLFGFAPQDPSFYPRLTVEENIFHFGILYHLKKQAVKERMDYLLKLTKLESHRKKLAEHLSGGMQRRLSLACSLIHKPEVLMLDEPTADLDPILREEMWSLIKTINQKEGTTIIVASHLLEELEIYSDKVAILHEGQISKTGTLDEIKDMFAQNEIEVYLDFKKGDPNSFLRRLNQKAISSFQQNGSKLTIHTKQPYLILFDAINLIKEQNYQVKTMEVHRPSLKEVFELLEKK
ncbi:MAG: ABC transporter ATP-binding protein [Nanoarchaeota archaeon]|nr:ABC transporter ATP-binding protein [Nanoarchaeota archaeon]